MNLVMLVTILDVLYVILLLVLELNMNQLLVPVQATVSVHLAQNLQPLWHHVRHAARLEQLAVRPVPVSQDIIHLHHSAAAMRPNVLLVLSLPILRLAPS